MSRPSNNDVAKNIAGRVLTRVFVALGKAGITLTTTDMRDLIEAVEADLESGPTVPQQEKKPQATAIRVNGQ